MGIQRTAVALVTLTLAVGALAGCVSPTPVPPPPTAEEIAAMREVQAQDWWDSIATGTTMPNVAVVAELPPEEAYIRQTECLDAAALPGVSVGSAGEWTFDDSDLDGPAGIAVQVQWWICGQQYPAVGDFDWMLSPAQLEWLYDFLAERHIPCLRTLGIDVIGFPSREDFLHESNGYPFWLPYPETLNPTPPSSEWVLIAKRCPLPEIMHDYGLPGYNEGT